MSEASIRFNRLLEQLSLLMAAMPRKPERGSFHRDATVEIAPMSLPLDRLPPMARYPRLDYSTTIIESGQTAFARKSGVVQVRGVYTSGDSHSLVVVGVVRSAAFGRARSVSMAHWDQDTPDARIVDFFEKLCDEGDEHARLDLCLVEGRGASEVTPWVLDQAARSGIHSSYHVSDAPSFGIAADPHGNIFCGDAGAAADWPTSMPGECEALPGHEHMWLPIGATPRALAARGR